MTDTRWAFRSRGEAAPSHPTTLLAVLLGAGAFAIILAGTTSETFELDRFSVPKELALNLTALLAVLFLAAGWRNIRATVPDALLGAFVAWSGVSAALSANRWLGLRAFALTLSGFVIFIAARRVVAEARPADPLVALPTAAGRRRSALLNALALAGLVASLTGIVQAYGLEIPGLADERAPGGTFGNRNFLAHLTAIAVPLIALSAIRADKRATRLFWLIALAACGNAIVLTRSRAGWLGLAAAVIAGTVALFLARRTIASPTMTVRRYATIAAALGVGAVSALVLPNTLEWTSASPYAETLTRLTDYRAGSGRGRLIQYANTMKLVPRNPVFGTGPGNWFIEYPLVTGPGDPSWAGAEPIPTNPWPSSDWVALLAERGVVGLLLVVLAGLAIVATAARRLRGTDPPAALESAVLLSLLAATAVTGLFDAVLLNAAPTFFVATAVGLLLPRSGVIIHRTLPGRVLAGLVALMIAGALASAARSAQQLTAIRIVEDGGATRQAMERALEVDPPNHRLHLRLATRDCRHAVAAARLMPFHDTPAGGRGCD